MKKLGLLRWACVASALCVGMVTSSAQTFTLLHSFDGSDGSSPNALVLGNDGNFYGTTERGGATNACPNGANGCGTIFEVTPSGTLSLLQSFNGTNGLAPNGLVSVGNETLYGTTASGGANGKGTFFSIVPGGTLVTLYNFCSLSNCGDGFSPSAGLIQGTDGNFYGTTTGGAEPNFCTGNCGTIFKITSSGVLTTLYSFTGTVGSGWGPMTGIVQGSDGNFYGTTEYGGNECPGDQAVYCGTIFKITPAGALTQLYKFCAQEDEGCPDGSYPSGLVQGSDGNFYGTAIGGGTYGYGTVFKITPAGTFTILHSFNGTDGQLLGAAPTGIVQGTDGNYYGTASNTTSPTAAGTIFRMTPSGTLTTLYGFNCTTGCFPSGLLQIADGTFYGTASNGGTYSDGTVFSFSIGLGGTTPSTTTLGLAPATVTVGATGPVVMTAMASPSSGSGVPTGVVDFFNGSSEVGFANLNAGMAAFNYTPSGLSVGTYEITAIYSGDDTFTTSTSSAETLNVSSLPTAATPSFSPAGGTYSSTQNVTISDSTVGATIYYTDDGTAPTTSSAVYSGPIVVSSTETLNSIAATGGYLNSGVATATYTISPTADYTLSVTPTTLTIVAGRSGTAMLTVTPLNGFNSAATFSCSGLPSGATCSFNPASVTPSNGAISSTLTIITTAPIAALRSASSLWLQYALLMPLSGMIFAITPFRKAAFGSLRVLGMVAVLALASGLCSCGSSSNSLGGSTGSAGTPLGTDAVTLTASTSGSGSFSRTASLTITITQ